METSLIFLFSEDVVLLASSGHDYCGALQKLLRKSSKEMVLNLIKRITTIQVARSVFFKQNVSLWLVTIISERTEYNRLKLASSFGRVLIFISLCLSCCFSSASKGASQCGSGIWSGSLLMTLFGGFPFKSHLKVTMGKTQNSLKGL